MTATPARPSIAAMASGACDCGSGQSYAECCRPLHKGEREAADAVALMRSRFCAFAKGEVAYLWKTLAADYPDRKRPEADVLKELKRSCSRFRYMGLQILDQQPPDAEGVARVLFLAKLFEKGRDISFVERSDFTHDGTGWRYLRGNGKLASTLRGDVKKLTLATFPG